MGNPGPWRRASGCVPGHGESGPTRSVAADRAAPGDPSMYANRLTLQDAMILIGRMRAGVSPSRASAWRPEHPQRGHQVADPPKLLFDHQQPLSDLGLL